MIAAAASFAMLLPAGVHAQNKWLCSPTTACAGASTPSADVFTLKLQYTPSTPAPDIPVRIVPAAANLQIPGATAPVAGELLIKTDADGMIQGRVIKPQPGQKHAFIAEFPTGQFLEQELTFGAAQPRRLSTYEGTTYWYASSQIRDAVVWTDGLDAAACNAAVVRFSPSGGGSVTADSVWGSLDGAVCAFRTDWRLGEQVGRQVLEARLGSGPPVQIPAIARRRSSVRVALAAAFRRGGVHAISTPQIGAMKVRRELPDGLIVEYDSIVKGPSTVKESDWEGEALPLILFDTPIRPAWDRVRVSIGVSPLNIKRDFFLGASIGQAWWGSQAEDAGFDIQGGALITRPERLETPDLCERNLDDPALRELSCQTTSQLRFGGFVLLASADTQALLSAVGKMIGLP